MTNITLVGTIHSDPSGDVRLKNALRLERPDVITLEASLESIDFFDTHSQTELKGFLEELRSQGMSEETITFFREYSQIGNFEVRESQRYARENKIPLVYVDDPESFRDSFEELRMQTRQFFNSVDFDFFDGINMQGVSRGIDSIYDEVENIYDGGYPQEVLEKVMLQPMRGKFIGRRDTYMAEQILRLISFCPDATRFVHVGGCYHNVSDPIQNSTLYSKLEKFNPKRKTLKSYQ